MNDAEFLEQSSVLALNCRQGRSTAGIVSRNRENRKLLANSAAVGHLRALAGRFGLESAGKLAISEFRYK
jgi:hypothetical protein